MTLPYSLIENEGRQAITVLIDGVPLVASNEHPNWVAIKEAVLRAAATDGTTEGLADLFETETAVRQRFDKYSDRVSVSGGTVYLDGEPQNGVLVDHIVRALNDGTEDFGPLVLFMENIQNNPSERSREQLYQWLEASNRSSASGGFTIDQNGHIRGYKGVAVVGDGQFTSISSGKATVNGEVHNGRIPQTFGDVVEMPRGSVADDPNVACHTGLHVGVYEYASGFAQGAVLEVSFNPRDVVSVPNDHYAQKLRTCRYTVIRELDAPISSAVQVDYPEEEDYEEYDGDDEDVLGEWDSDLAEEIANEADRSGLVNGGHLNFDWNTLTAVTPTVQDVTAQVKAAVEAAVKPLQDTVNELTKKSRPTDSNHLKQKRGPGGKFLPKS